ncbi:Bcr/CflA family efflux MFS transporter [Oleidesulfovibrio sp.]|uniref:Bcr/CflA family efflux MFS transporter n=1 Tax=Oleidesulfovibrio sp. TaxID=2909707 RepID=UPI003A8B0F15
MSNFVLILLLAAFPALSTDMYLPAIPTLCTVWDIPLSQANLSLVVFFIAFSSFLLIHGPLSDRFGRRPILLTGILLFITGSLLCAFSQSINALIAARVVQAIGAAAASALSFALAKDLYDGEYRKKLLAYIGIIIPLCTMTSPTIGALILQQISWRGIFILQGTLALFALYGSFRLQEPLTEKESGGVAEALGRYGILFRNAPFMIYCVAFAMAGLAFFAFIASSSNIYITTFGMSEKAYGLLFAFNAVSLTLGSFMCSRLCVGMESRHILYISFSGMLLAALCMVVLGNDTPVSFAVTMFFYTMFLGMSRPISNHMILEQVDRYAGAAASLVTFFFFLCGALAMEIVSLDWQSKPFVIATLGVIGTVLPLGVTFAMRYSGRTDTPQT